MKKVALIFPGCGHKDGAEITETVSLLVSLSELKTKVTAFSLDEDFAVTDHLTKEVSKSEKRNLMREGARITRGDIQDLNSLVVDDFDALVMAGGYGNVIHFSNWASKGSLCEVHPEVARIIGDFFNQQKPIGAVCVSPVLLAKVLGKHKITITLGPEAEICKEARKTGAELIECPVDDFITDRDNKIITTPAFMYEATYDQVFKGIKSMVGELVEMA